MAIPAASGGLKFLKPKLRIQGTDVQAAAAAWGVCAGVAAMWVVQPFTWIRKTFIEKPEPEGN